MLSKEALDEIKFGLSIDEVFNFVEELGGEPQMINENCFVSRTICHNAIGEGSFKLYYYDNTKLFKCYTDCGDYFDIFELVLRRNKTNNIRVLTGEKTREWQLSDSIQYVLNFFNIDVQEAQSNEMFFVDTLEWRILNNYKKRGKQIKKEKNMDISFKYFSNDVIKNFPQPRIKSWEKEGIDYNVLLTRNIHFDPSSWGVLIPHYDINNNLIGIRIRTFIKENEIFGKYRPAIINHIMYNHPLGFNLYNLNNSKEFIKKIKKAIVFEGEKSCLIYASIFGIDNDISVASCGSSLTIYQIQLLQSLGVEEIIIAYDKQFKEAGDLEWQKWTDKLKKIKEKYQGAALISFLHDNKNLLEYKDSPIDRGKDVFLELFKNRIILK